MRKYYIIAVVVAFVFLVIGLAAGVFIGIKRGVPFVTQKEQWTIGIYTGESPFIFPESQSWRNPVLVAEDVTDVPAKFVADPFLINDNSTWYLFFEVYNLDTAQGDIAIATSTDAKNWRYGQVVLDEPFHLSYPYVFKWQNDYYLIPESWQSNSIRLYKASKFPTEWFLVSTLIDGKHFLDPSIVYFNDRWWIFVSFGGNDTLRLYYADELTGPWQEHPSSPIVEGDKNIARPGGRILVYDGQLFRYAQDDYPTYGNQIWAFEITELTSTSYKEKLVSQNPILRATGSGWNAKKMHHIDPHQIAENRWIASVDGFGTYWVFGLQY